MSGIRGKPRAMYVYRDGRKVLLRDLPKLRLRWILSHTESVLEPETPTPEQRRKRKVAEQRRAAQNLQALPRPLKPPDRRSAT